MDRGPSHVASNAAGVKPLARGCRHVMGDGLGKGAAGGTAFVKGITALREQLQGRIAKWGVCSRWPRGQ